MANWRLKDFCGLNDGSRRRGDPGRGVTPRYIARNHLVTSPCRLRNQPDSVSCSEASCFWIIVLSLDAQQVTCRIAFVWSYRAAPLTRARGAASECPATAIESMKRGGRMIRIAVLFWAGATVSAQTTTGTV